MIRLLCLHDNDNDQFIGRYEAGLPSGPCWLRVKGGAWLHGDMDKVVIMMMMMMVSS